MKIVIVGAGEVGTHLAKMLVHEDQNIILMDSSSKRIEEVSRHLEALTMIGNPLSIVDLENASAAGADLFVCVTPDGATNLMSCVLAKRIGAKHTIARVSDCQHIAPEYRELYRSIGVDEVIYPEELAAIEITSTTLNPWARQYYELFGGKLVLVGIKVRDGAPIIGKRLMDLRNDDALGTKKFYHIVALKRDLDTVIPDGNTIIQPNDLVYFTCSREDVERIRQLTNKPNPEVRKIIIMGASRVAMQTIKHLPKDIRVCLIEQDKEKCLRLAPTLPRNVDLYHGDGRDPDIIKEVGIRDAQAFIALTEHSEANVLACLAAKRDNVYKTIAKEENIDYISLAYRLDIGTLINKKLLAAGHIFRMLLDTSCSSTFICLSLMNHAEVAEFVVTRTSPLLGKRIKDLKLPRGITFGGMLRRGELHLIDGDTVLEPEDRILIFYYQVKLNQIKRLFY